MTIGLTPRINDKDGRSLYRLRAVLKDGRPWHIEFYAKTQDNAIDLAMWAWPGTLADAQAIEVQACEWRTIYEFDHRKEPA